MHNTRLPRFLFLCTAFTTVWGSRPPAFAQEFEFKRSREDKAPLSFSQPVASYRAECETVVVFGPDPSCGPKKSCVDCRSEYESCEHPVQQCSDVLDHWTDVKVNVTVDPMALLLKGEVETLKFHLDPSSRTVSLASADGRYGYRLSGNPSLSLHDAEEVVSLGLDLETIALQLPPNDLQMISLTYETPTQFKVVFRDPQVGIRAQMRDVHYLFELLEGRKRLIYDIFPVQAVKRPNGLFEATVKKGDRGWRADPSSLTPRSERLFKYSVRRDAYYLQNDYTAPKKVRVLGAGGNVRESPSF